MENLNNVADTLAVDIITSVVSETHREGLRIETESRGLLEGGSVLQFDNCYTGYPMSRLLRVKNTTVRAMDISLSSDKPGEVCGMRDAPPPPRVLCVCFLVLGRVRRCIVPRVKWLFVFLYAGRY